MEKISTSDYKAGESAKIHLDEIITEVRQDGALRISTFEVIFEFFSFLIWIRKKWKRIETPFFMPFRPAVAPR